MTCWQNPRQYPVPQRTGASAGISNVTKKVEDGHAQEVVTFLRRRLCLRKTLAMIKREQTEETAPLMWVIRAGVLKGSPHAMDMMFRGFFDGFFRRNQ